MATPAPPSSTPHVFTTLDGMRGVAALFVILRHWIPFFGNDIQFSESFLAVDLFFALSGAVLCHAYEKRLQTGMSALHFTYLRIVRLYPLYLLGTVIMVGTLFMVPDRWENEHFLFYCVLALLFLPNIFVNETGAPRQYAFPLNRPGWSLFFELIANIAYASCIRFLNTRALLSVMAVSALGIFGCLVYGPHHNLDIGWTPNSLPGGLFRVGYSFSAGVLLFRHFAAKKRRASGSAQANLAAFATLAMTGALLALPMPDSLQPYYNFIAATLLFPALVYAGLLFQPRGALAPVCKFLGAISYAVYAIHAPLGDFVKEAALKAGSVDVKDYAPLAGYALMAALIMACWALDRFYDAPIRKALVKLWPTSRKSTQPRLPH